MKKDDLSCLNVLDAYRDRLYVAGGPVRDLFLGRGETPDVDIIVPRDLAGLPAEFARRVRGRYVLLHEEKGQLTERVVVRGDPPMVFDFTRLQGASVEEDLSMRDFTINAMALPLGDWVAGNRGRVIDPHNGRRDIRERRISAVSERSLTEDPLRMLRAFRLSAELRFRIARETLSGIRAYRSLLERVSGERIRDELLRMLSCFPATPVVVEMDRAGILAVLFPEIREMKDEGRSQICGTDPWKQALTRLRALETVIDRKEEYFNGHAGELENDLSGHMTPGRSKSALIKLSVLLCVEEAADPSGAGALEGAVLRLRLSRREGDFLRKIPRGLRELEVLFRGDRISRREAALFFSRNQADYLALFLLHLSRAAASRDPALEDLKRKIMQMLLRYEREIRPALQSPPLVDGKDLMNLFDLRPGPVIGRVLRDLREAQLAGVIGNRSQAIAHARRLLGR